MKCTTFKIGELVKYPVFNDDGNMTSLEVGIVVDSCIESHDDFLDANVRWGDVVDETIYKVMGGSTRGDSWYYPWEILKLEHEDG